MAEDERVLDDVTKRLIAEVPVVVVKKQPGLTIRYTDIEDGLGPLAQALPQPEPVEHPP